MIISDAAKQAGQELWPMHGGDAEQLTVIQRAINATAIPLLQRIISTTHQLREMNRSRAAQCTESHRIPEVEAYFQIQKEQAK